jgi:hypothetical protein
MDWEIQSETSRFHWQPAAAEGPVDLSETPGLVVARRMPLYASPVKVRLSDRLLASLITN